MKNMLQHSIRILSRQKAYIFINVAGLSIAVASSILIALFIFHHLSYDRFNEKKDRIFKLVRSGTTRGENADLAITCPPAGPAMFNEFPEVEDFTRIRTVPSVIVKYQNESFFENDMIEADSSFFNIFSIPLIRGDKNTALKSPHQIVLSESAAKRIFGSSDPMNRTLNIGNNKMIYSVSGIMQDIPETAHFRASMIGSFITNPMANNDNWGNIAINTYLLLKPEADNSIVNSRLQQFYNKYHKSMFENSMGISLEDFFAQGNRRGYYLQPLIEIHLNPDIFQNMKPAYDPKYLLILSSVALLIILIAVFNFMNLSTAQGINRAKEVGIKKVSGSSRSRLINQFLSESVILSLIALILAVIIIENALPFLNNLLNLKLKLELFSNWYVIPILLLFTVFVGLISGSYPAFFLSAFNPYTVLKEKLRDNLKSSRLRSSLVILQFLITFLLVTGSVIMYRQISYMVKKDLGFNKEQLLVISHAEAIDNRIKTFKESLSEIRDVVSITASTGIPGHSESGSSYTLEGRDGQFYNMTESYIDYDFFDTYGLTLSSGRSFKDHFKTDKDACIVNESALKEMNLSNPYAVNLINGNKKIPIVGVVKNFHFESVRNKIGLYVFRVNPENNNYGYVTIRLSKDMQPSTISKIEKIWNDFVPSDPIQFFFMDQDFAQNYKEEKQQAQLSILFTILAIFIATFGLFGLTSYTIEQRTKEIGLRKTMGASVSNLFFIITKDFILLVVIAAAIGIPAMYFAADKWLQNFYYRINLKPFDFLIGITIALVIVLVTISYRAIKSARTNPVEALRYE